MLYFNDFKSRQVRLYLLMVMLGLRNICFSSNRVYSAGNHTMKHGTGLFSGIQNLLVRTVRIYFHVSQLDTIEIALTYEIAYIVLPLRLLIQ